MDRKVQIWYMFSLASWYSIEALLRTSNQTGRVHNEMRCGLHRLQFGLSKTRDAVLYEAVMSSYHAESDHCCFSRPFWDKFHSNFPLCMFHMDLPPCSTIFYFLVYFCGSSVLGFAVACLNLCVFFQGICIIISRDAIMRSNPLQSLLSSNGKSGFLSFSYRVTHYDSMVHYT